MGQVTIYLDNELENKMKSAARAGHVSVSKWIAYLIRQRISTEWPLNVIALAGCWGDDFPTLEEIRSPYANDSLREEM
ncbi:MAG: CopG family transcriptional regulator [Candidatus Sabulitectum sp.]|nr:CopG family transcriptional regulator [Candidatus Sabulitectum sp.]